jgi:hypothetical protein
MTGAIIILFLLLLPATGFALWYRRQPTTNNRPPATVHRPLVATTTPPKARPGIDYAAERQMIRLALAGGMAPGAVAGLLRGSPQARRQRVLKVAREQQRVAPQQKLEAATA